MLHIRTIKELLDDIQKGDRTVRTKAWCTITSAIHKGDTVDSDLNRGFNTVITFMLEQYVKNNLDNIHELLPLLDLMCGMRENNRIVNDNVNWDYIKSLKSNK